MTSKNWCFTLNNPTVDDAANLVCQNPRIKLLVAALETGESGTLHYQGYLELDRHRRISSVKSLIPRAHLEKRKGTAKQAVIYCLKELSPTASETLLANQSNHYIGSLHEPTDLPVIIMQNTGAKTLSAILSEESSKTKKRDDRLLHLKELIDKGSNDLELANEDFPIFVQYFKGFHHYRLLKATPRNHEVNVIVIQGPTGTGKSKYCLDNYPGAYWKQRSQWWDNYEQQEAVIIDEFYGWIPFDTLLRICDRYPLLVETKGGQVNFSASTIIFTTNTIPDRWYKNVYFEAFVRRVSKWMVFPTWGNTLETLDYHQAHEHMTMNQGVGSYNIQETV